GISMKSRRPVNSTMSSYFSSISCRLIPSASPPRMMFRLPERSFSSAAPMPSRFGRLFAYTAPRVAGVSPVIVRMSVDLPDPWVPMMPIDSLAFATKETPLSACTVCIERPRFSRPPMLDAVAFLPVARVLYSTCTSSQMTTGSSTASPSVAPVSDGSAIALLRLPEEDRADGRQDDRPHAEVEPVLDRHLVILQQDPAGDREHVVQRVPVVDGAQDGRTALQQTAGVEEHTRGVED